MPATQAQRSIFMTGANGFVGSAITELAIPAGYAVTGLSRSEASDEKLRRLGATPVRGDLRSYDVLTRESAKADVVIHLADSLANDLTQPYFKVIETAKAAADAIAEGLRGSNKPLVVTSGSLVTAADPGGNETNEASPLEKNPAADRFASEEYALAKSELGIRTVAIRLAPWVYGRAASGVRMFMAMGAKAGKVLYVGDGSARTSTVHVEDAARLYMLAVESGRTGEAYNATSQTDVTFRQLAEAMANALDCPAVSLPFQEMEARMGVTFLARFLSTENRASSAKARQELGWEPKARGILDEINLGSYVELAKGLKLFAA